MLLICGLLFSWLFVRSSFAAHPPSPCPDIFSYEGTEPEYNRWYGEISLTTYENLVGIRLDVELDRPSDLMVSWMGDITTNDNVKFTILNLNQKLRPGPPVLSRIMVKFNRSMGSPRVLSIRLNGRKICPEVSTHNSENEESSKPQIRPDPEFGDTFTENAEEYPANENVDSYNNNRPNAQSNNNNNRPNTQQSNNNNNNNNRPNAQSNNNNNNNNRPVSTNKPSTATTEEPYTTRRPTKTTENPYESAGNSNNKPSNNNPNVVQSLQAIDTNSNSQLHGVINELLQNQSSGNKTVIITVIENNKPNQQQSQPQNQPQNQQQNQQQNRPNNSNGNREPVPAVNGNSNQTRPNQSSNRPPEQQPTTSPNKKPNNQGGGSSSSSSSINSHQVSFSTDSCGQVKLAIPLVTAGQSTHRGQWPWHVAMYLIEGINLSYHCGGSLVSKNKIVTAAHCVTGKQNDAVINSSKIVIYLGRYHQLQYSDELGVQTKQVSRINVFPSYNSSNYLGDIAVLTLSSDVEFTDYVNPVCLWEESDSLDGIVGKDGTVVGWGFDENDTPTEELKMAKMPVVSHQTCLWSYPQFYSEFTSDKTYCAGFRNGTSVCNGDSGGGMVFNRKSKWYLRGIVSVTVPKEGLRVCDTKYYVVFTDVAKYLDFVKKNLQR